MDMYEELGSLLDALAAANYDYALCGGLALAVGILVDEATVEIENIHAQLQHSDSVALAVRQGNAQTAIPRLLAMLCTLAVFVPFSLLYMKERIRLDYLWAGLCILGAVFFIFRQKLFGT